MNAVEHPGAATVRSIILRRAGSGLLTVWLISLLVFLAVHVLPGNAAISLLGHDTNPLAMQALTKQLGLDRSLPYQYWHWVSGFFTGNWGSSLVSSEPVSKLVWRDFAATTVLTLFTMLITIPLAIVLGTWSAVRNGRPFDSAVSMVTLCLSAIPGFAVGVIVIYLLASNVFHLLPAASTLDPNVSVWGVGPAQLRRRAHDRRRVDDHPLSAADGAGQHDRRPAE
jgi:peptide/nickel transport system permease protein